MQEYSLADLAAVTDGNKNNIFGENNLITILILFLFMANGGFGFGGTNRNNVVTTEDLANGFNFNSLQEKTNDILSTINGVNSNLSNAICTLGYQDAQHTYELGSKIDACCCNTQRAVDSVKFDMANYSAGISQLISDKFAALEKNQLEQKISDQASQIQQLQLSTAMCGIPRISTYAYGVYPYPYQTNCGCNCPSI